MNNDEREKETTVPGTPRRTVVKGAAWSLPLIAAAVHAPLASATLGPDCPAGGFQYIVRGWAPGTYVPSGYVDPHWDHLPTIATVQAEALNGGPGLTVVAQATMNDVQYDPGYPAAAVPRRAASVLATGHTSAAHGIAGANNRWLSVSGTMGGMSAGCGIDFTLSFSTPVTDLTFTVAGVSHLRQPHNLTKDERLSITTPGFTAEKVYSGTNSPLVGDGSTASPWRVPSVQPSDALTSTDFMRIRYAGELSGVGMSMTNGYGWEGITGSTGAQDVNFLVSGMTFTVACR